jgi:hypothetical protein
VQIHGGRRQVVSSSGRATLVTMKMERLNVEEEGKRVLE